MRGYVKSSWGQIHYRSFGEGGPTLFLFHESPYSSEIFKKVLPLLGRTMHVVAFDTPGYGESDPPPEPVAIETYSSALLDAIDATGAERFAIFGSHTGASLAVEVVSQAAPGRVSHLIACGIPMLTVEQRDRYVQEYTPEIPIQEDGGHLLAAWLHYVKHMGEETPLDLLHLSAILLLGNLERYHWAYRAAFGYDPRPALQQVTVPTLLVNTADDPLLFGDEEALGLIPNAELAIIPGRNRKPYWRVPETFAEVVVSFLSA